MKAFTKDGQRYLVMTDEEAVILARELQDAAAFYRTLRFAHLRMPVCTRLADRFDQQAITARTHAAVLEGDLADES